jgi:peroxiredoxin
MLEIGETAPHFELRGTTDDERRTYRLSEFTDDGLWVPLTFYAFDFNPIRVEGMCSLCDAEFFEFHENLSSLGIVREESDGMRRVHERVVFLIDDSRTIRFATSIDAESPDEIDLSPINESIRRLRS